ncbi:DEAD-box ATP-dependent RNA helicase 5 [Nymphaea thermarum]|nr:DEAD-box ATP-dependent RNA helicase 5 [Nymphaea thermarum]
MEEAGEGCSDREAEAVPVSRNGGAGKVRPGKKKQEKLAKEGATVEFDSNGVVKAEETDKWNECDYADVRRMKKTKKGKEENGTVESAGNGFEKTGVEKGNEQDFKEKVVTVSGNDVELPKYTAFKSFVDSGLPREVLHCCKTFTKPSPIQSRAWPFLLDGRDFIGIAATGSEGQQQARPERLPLCLVLSPTRELAQQIADVLSDSGRPCGLKTDIVVGTPGRLKDLIEMGICCLKEVSFVVSHQSSHAEAISPRLELGHGSPNDIP